MKRLPADEVRTGAAYETDRVAELGGLAAAARDRRVALGDDLVLVFESRQTVRAALEELVRAERISDGERVAAEAAAFATLLGEEDHVVATLYLDVADPVALAERLAELAGVEETVSLEVGGQRALARSDPGDGGSGAFRLAFPLDERQRAGLVAGSPATVRVEHRACRALATLSDEQVRAIGAELRR